MALIVLSVNRDKLPPHSDDDFEQWVKYQVGQVGHIDLENPLDDIDLEATVREIG